MAPRGLGALLAIAAALSGLNVAWGAAFNVTDLRERREAGDGVIFMLLSQLQDVLNAPDRTADVVVLLQAGQAGVNTMGQLLFQRLSQAVEEYKRTHSERAAQEIEMYRQDLEYLKQVPRVMEEQSREFRVAARSFHRSLAETGREDAIFFVELPESDMTFKTAAKELGLQQAIEVAYFPTTARFAPVDDRRIDLKEHPETPFTAETLVDWVGKRSGLRAAVHRWSLFRTWWWPFLAVAALLALLYLGLFLTLSGLAANPWLISGVLLTLWWFSSSGGLFNIIKHVPLVAVAPAGPGRPRQVHFFLDHPQMQLGLEGYSMGACMLIASALLLLVTVGVPKMPPGKQRMAGLVVSVVAAAWAVLIHDLFHRKAGLHIRPFVSMAVFEPVFSALRLDFVNAIPFFVAALVFVPTVYFTVKLLDWGIGGKRGSGATGVAEGVTGSGDGGDGGVAAGEGASGGAGDGGEGTQRADKAAE